MEAHWEHHPHLADIGVRGFAGEADHTAGLARKVAKLQPILCIKG